MRCAIRCVIQQHVDRPTYIVLTGGLYTAVEENVAGQPENKNGAAAQQQPSNENEYSVHLMRSV